MIDELVQDLIQQGASIDMVVHGSTVIPIASNCKVVVVAPTECVNQIREIARIHHQEIREPDVEEVNLGNSRLTFRPRVLTDYDKAIELAKSLSVCGLKIDRPRAFLAVDLVFYRQMFA